MLQLYRYLLAAHYRLSASCVRLQMTGSAAFREQLQLQADVLHLVCNARARLARQSYLKTHHAYTAS